MKRALYTSHIMRALVLLVVAAVSWWLCPLRESSSTGYIIQEGKPWQHSSVTAEWDFPIYKPTDQLEQEQMEALQQWTPCFRQIHPDLVLVLSAEDMEMLHEEEVTNIALVDANTLTATYSIHDVYTPKSAYLKFDRECEVNLAYDTLMSERLRDAILSEVSPTEGMVQRGEKIIDRGELVTRDKAQMLRSLLKAKAERHMDRQQYIFMEMSYALWITMIMAMLAIYILFFRRRLWKIKNVLFFGLLMLMIIVPSSLIIGSGNFTLVYLVPFAWVAIIARVFYDSRTAFILNLVTCMIVAIGAPAPLMFLFTQVVVGSIAVATLKDITQRAQLAHTAGWVLLAYVVTYTVTNLCQSGDFRQLEWEVYTYLLINAALIICAYGVIYLLEKAFKLVSSITLVELANINSELMHEFAEKAPGTFQHSLQVSNLATAAAKQISANVLLVRTGALYHDIGKMVSPLNYTENQNGGNNPLNQLSNQDAAREVIAHVTEGIRIAQEHHLPEVIIQCIATHHGDSITRYFYNSEVNRVGADRVNIDDFRYPGPKPQSKENAILMMADAVEARSRSMSEFTEDDIRQMVDDMVEMQVRSGQFVETKLSFRDVEVIKRVFIERLILMNHHRIVYPTIDEPAEANAQSAAETK